MRKHGFSFYQWRAQYGGMEAEDAKRLKELAKFPATQRQKLQPARYPNEVISMDLISSLISLPTAAASNA